MANEIVYGPYTQNPNQMVNILGLDLNDNPKSKVFITETCSPADWAPPINPSEDDLDDIG